MAEGWRDFLSARLLRSGGRWGAILLLMTNDHVSTVERVYREWARGNFRAGGDLLCDDVEYAVDYPHGPQTYVGREGVATYMREILREWAHMRVEAEEIVEVEDRVFVAQHQVQTGQLSGVRVEEHTAAVWTFSGDRVVRLQLFHDPAEARVVAGLAN
jgi:ketosteroid isomerase-like protein